MKQLNKKKKKKCESFKEFGARVIYIHIYEYKFMYK